VKLDVSNLEYKYRKVPVLKGVEFSASAGQCICVLGENGAGKTTLFRCLLGFLGDYNGDIHVDGVEGRKMSAREIARKIAYIPQAHAPTFNYTVYETVLMGTNILTRRFRTPGSVERQSVYDMLETMNIGHLAQRGFAELSGGERQLTLIARALAQKSHILVMDEPTANLDYGNQYRVLRRIRQLASEGYLVLMSTHNPEHALLYADMVLVLKEGKAMMFGAPDEVLSPETIKKVYGVSVELEKMQTGRGQVPVFIPNLD